MSNLPPPRAPTFPTLPKIFSDQEVEDSAARPVPPAPMDTFSTPQSIPNSSPANGDVPVVHLPVEQRRESIVLRILLWRDPKVTAVYFASAMIFFYLTLLRQIPGLTVIGLGIAVYQALGMIASTLNKHLGGKFDKHIGRPPVGTPLFKQDVAHRWADVLVEEGNEIQDILRDLMYCDKPKKAVPVLLGGVVLYWFGFICSVVSLLFLLTLSVFTLPLAYEKNKAQVDDTIAKASDTVARQVSMGQKLAQERSEKFLENAPPAARELAARVGLTPQKKKSS